MTAASQFVAGTLSVALIGSLASTGVSAGDASTAARQQAPSETVSKPATSAGFEDCSAVCPEMVIAPPGRLGPSRPNAPADPPLPGVSRPIVVERGFGIARFDVTVGQYRAFMRDSGYDMKGRCTASVTNTPDIDWEHPGFDQADDSPVVCVSYADAQAYAAWLSQRTGRSYRLPTDIEWEYAARAGTSTFFYWGDSLNDVCTHANLADRALAEHTSSRVWGAVACDDGYPFTSVVGRFPPNGLGLYDMAGNVAQWVTAQGCMPPRCQWVMTKGGSWYSSAVWLAPFAFQATQAATRTNYIGFRVVRDM